MGRGRQDNAKDRGTEDMKNFVMSNIWAGKWNDSPGVGHEFRNWLTGYNIAEYYGLTFVHSPFAGDHVVPESKWKTVGRVDVPVERWEEFLNFGRDELTLQDLPDKIRIVELPKIACHASVDNQQFAKIIKDNKSSDEPILFTCPFNQFLSMRWKLYLDNRFKNKYWNRRKCDPIPTPFLSDRISVGIHIRRCDVNELRYPDRFLSNAYYETIIKHILSLFPRADIHIYSDAVDIEEFANLEQLPNTTFHLCTDVFETFHSLVTSDIYVMGTGSWAILTAHLSRGVKITTEWNDAWNKFPANQGIVPVTKNGNFSVQLLATELEKQNEIRNA